MAKHRKRQSGPQPRPADFRRQAEEFVAAHFSFLSADFGYTPLGAVKVLSPQVDVRAYLNVAAGRQVEVSGRPLEQTLHGLIRQVENGVPSSYASRETFIEFWELEAVRSPDRRDTTNHNIAGWHRAVEGSAQLLRCNPDLLDGSGWIPRAAVRAAIERRHGFCPDDRPRLAVFKRRFRFLIDAGYALTYDSDMLTPHEYGVTPELCYEKGADVITIARRGDWYEDAWTIERNGTRVGEVFSQTPGALASLAGELATALKRR
jgi:hypothetical protein